MPNAALGGFPVQSRPNITAYINIQDVKASGTASGTFTSGAWQTRTLNTVVNDTFSVVSLSSNQVTLPAGTYDCKAMATASAVDRHQIRLQNVTDATTTLLGLNSLSLAAGPDGNPAFLSGRFTTTAQKTFELQHRCQTTRSTDGYGFSASWGNEVYAVLEFWREDTLVGIQIPGQAPGVVTRRVYSRPTDNVTCTGNNTWNAFGTDWTLTVPGVRSGQYVLLRAMVSMNNSTNYHGSAFFRVTGGSTYLFGSVTTAQGHVTGTSIEYVDIAPGAGDITYQIRGGGNTGTVTLRDNADSTFSIDEGNSIFVAEAYYP